MLRDAQAGDVATGGQGAAIPIVAALGALAQLYRPTSTKARILHGISEMASPFGGP